jgi:hypothetical protein
MDGSLGEFERIHHQSSCRPRTTSNILTAISDDRSLILFNAIGLMPAGTGIFIRKSGLEDSTTRGPVSFQNRTENTSSLRLTKWFTMHSDWSGSPRTIFGNSEQ